MPVGDQVPDGRDRLQEHHEGVQILLGPGRDVRDEQRHRRGHGLAVEPLAGLERLLDLRGVVLAEPRVGVGREVARHILPPPPSSKGTSEPPNDFFSEGPRLVRLWQSKQPPMRAR